MRTKVTRWVRLAAGISVSAVVCTAMACGGCGEGGGGAPDGGADVGVDVDATAETDGPIDGLVCGSTLEGSVAAAAWMEPLTGVGEYHYRGSFGANELEVDLVDTERDTLGMMVVSQVLEDEAEYPRGTMNAKLTASSDDLELFSRGEMTDRGYVVRTTLTDGNNEVDVVATFDYTACAPENLDQASPCAGPVPMEAPEFTVASCGLVWLTARQFGLFPALRSLRYEVDGSSSDSTPTTGGVRRDSDGESFVLEVFADERVTDAAEVGEWLDQTGASPLIGSASEELLTSAYTDLVWREAFREHVAECAFAEGQGLSWSAVNALESCSAQAVTGLRTHRQAQAGCNSAARRDEESWGEGNAGGSGGCNAGCVGGDPHLISFDGHAFDFQGAGEYVLAEATGGEPFTVQARMEPGGASDIEACKDVSVTTALAFTIGDRRISLYTDRDDPLWVDGSPVDPGPGVVIDLPEGARYEIGRTYRFWWPTGEMVSFRPTRFSSAVTIDLPDERSGEVRGLLGTFSGRASDEFTTRLGEELASPVSFEQLYGTFGDSWRVAPFESLFDYEAGESTATFALADFPEAPVDVSKLPEPEREEAAETCRERDIVDPWLFDSCVIDVVCAADPSAADDVAGLESPDEVTMPGDVSYTMSGALRAKPGADDLERGGIVTEAACRDDIASTIWVVDEREAVQLSEDVTVDAVDPGLYADEADLSGATVSAGTTVWSYVLHLDLDGRPEAVPASGSITFSEPIVGVVASGGSLSATDDLLGVEGAAYPGESDRALESGDDSFEIAPGGKKLVVKMRGEENIDQLRVLVAPEEMP